MGSFRIFGAVGRLVCGNWVCFADLGRGPGIIGFVSCFWLLAFGDWLLAWGDWVRFAYFGSPAGEIGFVSQDGARQQRELGSFRVKGCCKGGKMPAVRGIGFVSYN